MGWNSTSVQGVCGCLDRPALCLAGLCCAPCLVHTTAAQLSLPRPALWAALTLCCPVLAPLRCSPLFTGLQCEVSWSGHTCETGSV